MIDDGFLWDQNQEKIGKMVLFYWICRSSLVYLIVLRFFLVKKGTVIGVSFSLFAAKFARHQDRKVRL